jgi:hypothetical protein
VARGHVRIDRGVPTASVVPGMAGDAGTAVKQFDGRRRQPTIDLLASKAVGHRVVVADDLDVIVDADPDHLPFGKLVTRER